MIYEKFSGSLTGRTGIGFGCGTEALPSVFVSDGAFVTITDAPPENSAAWSSTGQHASSIDMAHHEELVDAKRFRENARHAFVDMNKIPDELDGRYDFVWSVCAYEHLGSIERGIRFVDRCCDLLKLGGISVHTTEFNIDDGETADNCIVVLFQKKHFLEMQKRAEARGFRVAPLDFSVGTGVFDWYVDTPPFDWEPCGVPSAAHLKAGIDGFRSTCFGIAITRQQ